MHPELHMPFGKPPLIIGSACQGNRGKTQAPELYLGLRQTHMQAVGTAGLGACAGTRLTSICVQELDS